MGGLDWRKVELGFHSAGVACPQCGYVFTRGFCNVTDAVPRKPNGRGPDGTYTVCTRCKALLVLDAGTLTLPSPVQEMLMTKEQRANIDAMRETLRVYERRRGFV